MTDRIDRYINIANYLSVALMYTNSRGIKEYCSGHFGCSYGINFILGHLFDFYNRHDLTHKEIIGTGHAGCALITNLWLTNRLNYSIDKVGYDKLRDDFGNSIRSEINSTYPDNIYDGGELGYSLANAYGYALNSILDYVVCIIGDGEAETGTICASYNLSRLLKTNAKVLPIINLNGYKMGSNSILSKYSTEELISYYTSLGYHPYIVENNSIDMYNALEDTLNYRNPLIVFISPKGYKGYLDISGSIKSHKDPIKGIDNKLDIINKWLDSYNVELFNDTFYETLYKIDIVKDNIVNKNLVLSKNTYNSNMEYLSNYLIDNNIQIFSPDEIKSNKISSGKVIELLSENVINGLYQGYTSSGNIGIFIGYEGFMSIITSQVNQYLKSIMQNNTLNSMTYILTSTWMENTYSHQSTSFIDELLVHDNKHINVYYPLDGKALVYYTNKSLNSNNMINAIVSSKGNIRQYNFDKYEDIMIIDKPKDYKYILVATGDYVLDNILRLRDSLKKRGIYCKIIYVNNISILNKIDDNTFYKYFDIDKPILYCYHGYSNTIKSYMFNRLSNIEIRGYSDLSYISGNVYDKLSKNNQDINVLERYILEVLHEL